MFITYNLCVFISGPSDAVSAKELPKYSDNDPQSTSSKDNDVLSKVGMLRVFFSDDGNETPTSQWTFVSTIN